MNAVELSLPNSEPSRVWMCGQCGRLHNRTYQAVGDGKGRQYTEAERDEFGRLAAVQCCDYRCEVCGEKVKPFHGLCDTHHSEKWAAESLQREAARFAAAKKLTEEQFLSSDASENPLYDGHGDHWFSDLDAVADYDGDERPAYLWCSMPIQWVPDVAGWLDDKMHDLYHEGAADEISAVEWKRLEQVVEAWWAEVKPTSYDPDYRRCVVLGESNGAA